MAAELQRRRVMVGVVVGMLLAATACSSGQGDSATETSDTSAAVDQGSTTLSATTIPRSAISTDVSSSSASSSSPSTSSPAEPSLAVVAPQVQAILDASLEPGVLDWTLHDVSVPATGADIAIRVRGWSDLILSSGTEVDGVTTYNADATFNASNIGSSITQDLAFELIRDGVLDPASPLSTWFPDYPNADRITVEMLLDESNGMGNFDNREFELVLADPGRTWTLDEVLGESAQEPSTGEPGVFDSTSHGTGIIAVARIMELVTGTSLRDLHRTHITEPLGLEHTYLSDGSTPSGFQPGFFQVNGVPANTADYPRTAYVTFGSPIWGVDSTLVDLLDYLDVAVHGSDAFGTALTPANFPSNRLNDGGALINGAGTGWNGFCPCEPVDGGNRVAFIGRGPNSVGNTVQMYDFPDEGVSIVVHYNSSEIESFEEIHAVVEQIRALVLPYAQ